MGEASDPDRLGETYEYLLSISRGICLLHVQGYELQLSVVHHRWSLHVECILPDH